MNGKKTAFEKLKDELLILVWRKKSNESHDRKRKRSGFRNNEIP